MNDQLERDIRNLFCNTGELSRDEVTGILLGLLERIQHLEQLRPDQEPVASEHITDGRPCWCEAETNYKDPETGISVIVHKEPQ